MSELTHKLPHQPWSKPSRNEEAYFHREEFRVRMRKARDREAARGDSERQQLLQLHRGHCPHCGAQLEGLRFAQGMAQQCPACLGVWMDHETFDRLTHPEDQDDYLTSVFRELLLQYTTGKIPAGVEERER